MHLTVDQYTLARLSDERRSSELWQRKKRRQRKALLNPSGVGAKSLAIAAAGNNGCEPREKECQFKMLALASRAPAVDY